MPSHRTLHCNTRSGRHQKSLPTTGHLERFQNPTILIEGGLRTTATAAERRASIWVPLSPFMCHGVLPLGRLLYWLNSPHFRFGFYPDLNGNVLSQRRFNSHCFIGASNTVKDALGAPCQLRARFPVKGRGHQHKTTTPLFSARIRQMTWSRLQILIIKQGTGLTASAREIVTSTPCERYQVGTVIKSR